MLSAYSHSAVRRARNHTRDFQSRLTSTQNWLCTEQTKLLAWKCVRVVARLCWTVMTRDLCTTHCVPHSTKTPGGVWNKIVKVGATNYTFEKRLRHRLLLLISTIVSSFRSVSSICFAFINLLCDDVTRTQIKLHHFQCTGSHYSCLRKQIVRNKSPQNRFVQFAWKWVFWSLYKGIWVRLEPRLCTKADTWVMLKQLDIAASFDCFKLMDLWMFSFLHSWEAKLNEKGLETNYWIQPW